MALAEAQKLRRVLLQCFSGLLPNLCDNNIIRGALTLVNMEPGGFILISETKHLQFIIDFMAADD